MLWLLLQNYVADAVDRLRFFDYNRTFYLCFLRGDAICAMRLPLGAAARPPHRTWCWRSCASAFVSRTSISSSSMSRCRHGAGPGQRDACRHVLGAQRLRDRLCRAAGVLWPARRTLPAQYQLPLGRVAVHPGFGRVRRRGKRGDARPLPPGAGGGRGADDPDIARASARLVPPSGAAARCGPGPRSGGSRPRSGR